MQNYFLAMDLKTTDYFLFVAGAYFVIKELIKLLGKKNKDDSAQVIRVTDEAELQYRQSMMVQHDKIVQCLQGMTVSLAEISLVSNSTNDKCENIKENVSIVIDRTKD